MSSEDNFDDKPLVQVDEKALAQALDNEHVFERSSAPPAAFVASPSSTDEFPDEPEPETEPMPEPEQLDAEFVDPVSDAAEPPLASASGPHSSYGHLDPASLAAAGSGQLHDPDLAAQAGHALASASALSLVSSKGPSEHASATESAAAGTQAPKGLVAQPHLAHLTQVGLVDADTWDEQIKPRIAHLQEQITEVNDRLDHLTTRKYR